MKIKAPIEVPQRPWLVDRGAAAVKPLVCVALFALLILISGITDELEMVSIGSSAADSVGPNNSTIASSFSLASTLNSTLSSMLNASRSLPNTSQSENISTHSMDPSPRNTTNNSASWVSEAGSSIYKSAIIEATTTAHVNVENSTTEAARSPKKENAFSSRCNVMPLTSTNSNKTKHRHGCSNSCESLSANALSSLLNGTLRRGSDPATKGLRVDTMVAIRSLSKATLQARPFYKTWLSYWPFGGWRQKNGKGEDELIFMVDNFAERAHTLEECLRKVGKCTALPIRFKTFIYPSMLKGFTMGLRDGEWSLRNAAMMQLWKFELDLHTTADIVAIMDDDACLVDHILPSEVVTEGGKLVARGMRVTRKVADEYHSKRTRALGIDISDEFSALFMTDFPVYVWRDMLPDFRASVVRHVFANATEREAGSVDMFWRAIADLMQSGWAPSDYSNLMHFALTSSKWSTQYEWQLIPTVNYPILNHATHRRDDIFKRCHIPAATVRDRDRKEFLAKYGGELLYGHGMDHHRAVYHEGQQHCDGYGRYESFVQSGAWNEHLVARQDAILAEARKSPISARDVCGSRISEAWEGCFQKARGGH